MFNKIIAESTLQQTFYGNTVKQYLVSLTILIGVILVLYIFKKIIINKIRDLSKFTKSSFDDLLVDSVSQIHKIFYLAVALYVAVSYLEIPQALHKTIEVVTIVIVAMELIRFSKQIAVFLAKRAIRKSSTEGEENKTIESVVVFVINVAVWSLGLLLALQNLGVNVTALLGSLGIGGIAIAFALQNILVDLFSFFSIYFDKPFQIGDFIALGDDMGTVEKIGIRSTRLKTIQGEELVISNSELTSSRINNYRKLGKRRIVSKIGVIYETSEEKLKKIPALIKNVIDETDEVEFERAHFSEYGDSALIFEYVYAVVGNDYDKYMDKKQIINFGIFKSFEKENISFAYPTQQIYLKNI